MIVAVALCSPLASIRANLPPGSIMPRTEQWWYNGRWNSVPPPPPPPASRPYRPPGPVGPSPAQQAGNAADQRALAAYNQGNWAVAAAAFEEALQYFPNDSAIEQDLANAQSELNAQRANSINDQGLAAFRQGDWQTAVGLFQQALAVWPGNAILQQNLASAQGHLADQRHDEQVAVNIHNDAIALVNQLSAGSPGGGLDFDGGQEDGGAQPAAKPADGLGFMDSGDANVVDARDVPSGLPKAVEDSIPHTPAGDCTRKGFEAVQNGDWKVALAWFQTAVLKEPGNPELRRLVDLAQYTLNRRIEEHSLPFEDNSTPVQPAPDAQADRQLVDDFIKLTHEEEDERLLFQGPPPPAPPSGWSKLGQWLDEHVPRQQEARPDMGNAGVAAVRD